ncbi:hypothetical protein D0Z06_05240 [Geodermatophilus marinus]|nr:hypothetical protein D0Z06_05240 [Geodermatophilus sp. LHW52908]
MRVGERTFREAPRPADDDPAAPGVRRSSVRRAARFARHRPPAWWRSAPPSARSVTAADPVTDRGARMTTMPATLAGAAAVRCPPCPRHRRGAAP